MNNLNLEASPSIHYIVWRFTLGGAELSIQHYAKSFGFDRSLYAYSLRKPNRDIFAGMPIKTDEGADSNWQCYLKYFNYCRRYRQQIFHLHNAGPVIALLTVLAGVKNPIYHIHGTIYWHNAKQKIYLRMVWFLVSLFKMTFVAVSNHAADIFQRDAINKRPLVIFNGVATEPFLEKRHQRKSPKRLGYAGRLFTGKNVDLVIRLFEEVADTYPELELHIAGDGTLRPELEAQAKQSPYKERIKFLGFVQDMPSFYASIDLFIFLSAYESFGNVLAEALLTGLPVLTSAVPVFKEIYGEEADFLLGDYRNYEQISQKFKIALAKFPVLAEKGFAMSEAMEAQFSIEKHLCQIKQLYANY
ncbi:MAG: glycosyltransferase family 4 protein [Saprospiraceae bacterium]